MLNISSFRSKIFQTHRSEEKPFCAYSTVFLIIPAVECYFY